MRMNKRALETRKGIRYSLNYDPDSKAQEIGIDRFKKQDIALAKAVAEVLMGHYAGHMWQVSACYRTGIVKIRLPFLPQNWHYIIRIDELKGDPTLRSVMRAGGEILERYKVPRVSGNFTDLLGKVPILKPKRNGKPLE